MTAPESVQQFLIRDDGGVVFYPDRLTVITDIVVTGIAGGASGIPRRSADNPLDTPEPGFGSPESAQGKIRSFQGAMSDRIQPRQKRTSG